MISVLLMCRPIVGYSFCDVLYLYLSWCRLLVVDGDSGDGRVHGCASSVNICFNVALDVIRGSAMGAFRGLSRDASSNSGSWGSHHSLRRQCALQENTADEM